MKLLLTLAIAITALSGIQAQACEMTEKKLTPMLKGILLNGKTTKSKEMLERVGVKAGDKAEIAKIRVGTENISDNTLRVTLDYEACVAAAQVQILDVNDKTCRVTARVTKVEDAVLCYLL